MTPENKAIQCETGLWAFSAEPPLACSNDHFLVDTRERAPRASSQLKNEKIIRGVDTIILRVQKRHS